MIARRRKCRLYVDFLLISFFLVSFCLFLFNTDVAFHLFPKDHTEKELLIQPAEDYCTLVDFLVIVHTRHDDQETRDFWRATYGSPQLARKYNYKLLFPVGLGPDPRVRLKQLDELETEHNWHGDILLGSYLDTYRNISHKQLSHLSYFGGRCPKKAVLLKIDDDVGWRVDKVAGLVGKLKEAGEEEARILCLVWHGMKVQKDPKSKWYVPPSIFNGTVYPEYCSGISYLITREAARRIVQQSQTIPFFWVDDVYITGFLPTKAKVRRESIAGHYRLMYDNGTALLLGDTTFQMGPRPRVKEMFQKVLAGIQRREKHPWSYYCQGPFCRF